MKCSLFCLLALLAYTLAVPLRQNNTEFLSNLEAFKKDSRIVGGTDTNIQHLPWNLSFRYRRRHICGASIITANRALTAANCYNGGLGTQPPFYDVLANSTTREQDWYGVIVRVTRIIRHPQYNNRLQTNDIAVLSLENSLNFEPGIQAIPIPIQDAAIPYGTDAIVSGWGLTIANNQGSTAPVLQYTTVPLITNQVCNVAYPNRITPDMVCAGRPLGGHGACQGDNGGPLVANGVLVGVVAWRLGCGRPNSPDVYSRVSHNVNFIRSYL